VPALELCNLGTVKNRTPMRREEHWWTGSNIEAPGTNIGGGGHLNRLVKKHWDGWITAGGDIGGLKNGFRDENGTVWSVGGLE